MKANVKYPNLIELHRHHPYSISTMANHAGATSELMESVLKGEDELFPDEQIGLSRLYGISLSVLFCPYLIRLDRRRYRHKLMIRHLIDETKTISEYQKSGSKEAERFLKYRGGHLINLELAFRGNLATYAQFLGVKAEIEDCMLFIRCENEKRAKRGKQYREFKGGSAQWQEN